MTVEDDREENKKIYNETVERDKLIYENIIYRYNLEWDRSKILDGKASGIISFVGIILALQSGIGAILIKDAPKTGTLFIITCLFFATSVLFLTFSIFCGLKAYYVKTWLSVPNATTLIEDYGKKDKSRVVILCDLGVKIAESIEKNKINNDMKRKFIIRGFKFLTLGLLFNLIFIFGLITLMSFWRCEYV